MTDRPTVMDDARAPLIDVPAHANVMAVIKALDGPVSWALLVDVISHLQATSPDIALSTVAPGRVEESLRDVVRDLRMLHLVTISPSGTELTPAADETIRGWNGLFTDRLIRIKAATSELLSPA